MSEVKPSPGQTLRKLHFRDRQLILSAVQQYASRNGDRGGERGDESNYKALRKLARLQDILNAEEVDEWYETLEAHLRKRVSEWRTREEERLKNGNGSPPERPPKLSDEEIAGPEREFVLSTSLDAFVLESLKSARFPTETAKWVDRLYAKYGFTEDP